MIKTIKTQLTSTQKLHNTRTEFLKYFPRKALRGLWVYKQLNEYYEVHIPKSDAFPGGFAWYGYALNAMDAKCKMFQCLIYHLEEKNK